MKIKLLCAAALLCAGLAPFGVSAQETVAETTIVVSAEFQRDWNRGNGLVADGLRELARAERDLVRRSAEAVNARNSRDSSSSQADNARRTFENLTRNTAFSDPQEARRWAGELDSAATDWERYTSRMSDSDRDLDRALRRQLSAQAKVNEAQAKIDQGRAMMAQAERSSAMGSGS